jgi:hypothetical protein
MAAATVETPRPGDVITVAEDNYMYGTGTLWLRVTSVEDHFQVISAESDRWLAVNGLQLRRDGSQLSERPRWALIRLNAVHIGLRA